MQNGSVYSFGSPQHDSDLYCGPNQEDAHSQQTSRNHCAISKTRESSTKSDKGDLRRGETSERGKGMCKHFHQCDCSFDHSHSGFILWQQFDVDHTSRRAWRVLAILSYSSSFQTIWNNLLWVHYSKLHEMVYIFFWAYSPDLLHFQSSKVLDAADKH